VLQPRLDAARVIDIFRKADQLPLIRGYLQAVQKNNITEVGGGRRRTPVLPRPWPRPTAAPLANPQPTHTPPLAPRPHQVNEALNGLLIEEQDFEGLRASIEAHDSFDQMGAAPRPCTLHHALCAGHHAPPGGCSSGTAAPGPRAARARCD
jgi:clathrin heavy chain